MGQSGSVPFRGLPSLPWTELVPAVLFSSAMHIFPTQQVAPQDLLDSLHVSSYLLAVQKTVWVAAEDLVVACTPLSRARIDKALFFGKSLGWFLLVLEQTSRRTLWRVNPTAIGELPLHSEGLPEINLADTLRSKAPDSTAKVNRFLSNLQKRSLVKRKGAPSKEWKEKVCAWYPSDVTTFDQNNFEQYRIHQEDTTMPELEITPATVQRLVTLWGNATATAFGRSFVSRLFTGSTPWVSPNPKEQRRWTDFVRLAVRLEESRIDFAEFCTAIMQHFASHPHGGAKRPATPRHVCGEYGRKIWEEWRQARLAEGAGSAKRVTAAAALGTQDRSEKFCAVLRGAYTECKSTSPEEAVSLTWGSEVLWVLRATEPSMRPAVETLLARPDGEVGDLTLRDAVVAGLAKIKAKPTHGARLLHLRNTLVGTPRPVLPVVRALRVLRTPGPRPTTAQVFPRMWRPVAVNS